MSESENNVKKKEPVTLESINEKVSSIYTNTNITRIVSVLTLGSVISLLLHTPTEKDVKAINERLDSLYKKEIVLPKAVYANKDSLVDLDFGNGQIYVQTKNGTFVPYKK